MKKTALFLILWALALLVSPVANAMEEEESPRLSSLLLSSDNSGEDRHALSSSDDGGDELDSSITSSQELINAFFDHVQHDPHEMNLIMNILNYRALMFENFIGELLAVAERNDDSTWDRTFASFLNAENILYAQTQPRTKKFLTQLDHHIIEEGSELSFKHFMLLERARRELGTAQKTIFKKFTEFTLRNPTAKTSDPTLWSNLKKLEKVIYGSLDDSMRIYFKWVTRQVSEATLNPTHKERSTVLRREILQLAGECKKASAHIGTIIRQPLPELYSRSSQLKQAYNELYIRLSWQLHGMGKQPQLLCTEQIPTIRSLPTAPFPIACIATPPLCLTPSAKAHKKNLLHLLKLVLTITDASIQYEADKFTCSEPCPLAAVSNFAKAFDRCSPYGKQASSKLTCMKKIIFEVITLQPWMAFDFEQAIQSSGSIIGKRILHIPAQNLALPTLGFQCLMKYHCAELGQPEPQTATEKADDWIVGTAAGFRQKKKSHKPKSNRSKRKQKTFKKKATSLPEYTQEAQSVSPEPARAFTPPTRPASTEPEPTELELKEETSHSSESPPSLESPEKPMRIKRSARRKKRSRFVKDASLLRELFNYDRIVEDNQERCIFTQDIIGGRQVTVVLFNCNNTEQVAPINLEHCDLTAFKRKRDAFHTISPYLCSHSHFGYWVAPLTIADQAGIHQNLAHQIRFDTLSQIALVIPAKIIHTPFCQATQADRHPGTNGAYVLIFDTKTKTCFHAMFHHIDNSK